MLQKLSRQVSESPTPLLAHAQRGRIVAVKAARRVVQAATGRLMVVVLADERVRTAVRGTISWSTVYDTPPDLIAIDRPSGVQSRLLHYSSSDPQVSVGRYCSLNEGSYLLTGGDHSGNISTYLFYYGMGAGPKRDSGSKGPIVIGNEVWQGFGSIVLPGVKVGDGAIIAASATVTRDVPPYAIVGGVPAKVIAYRFEEPDREALLRIRWWDWEEDKVRAHVDQLSCADVAGFIRRHDPKGVEEGCSSCW